MKIRKLTLTVAALFAASFFTATAAVEVGQSAPDFTLLGSDGKDHSLSGYKGKLVVLEWTNNGCPFVKKHYNSGNMQSLQKKYTGKGVVWLRIVSSAPGKQGYVTAAQAKEVEAEQHAASTVTLLDPAGKVGILYGAKTTPDMYVITPEGKLAYMGAIDDKPSPDPADIATAKNYVAAALDAVMAGKPVATPVTQSYGCSVKY